MCAIWVIFAKTGNPSTNKVKWEPYKAADRNTMMINNDCTMTMQSEPKSEQRKLLEPLMPYYIP
ncbi:MAG: carboxylesterase family protein [Firmicutes bacterium]|nr:carboxylesterase family protein [Bacillota bacterium]